MLVTAVSLPAFKQALGTLRRGGTCVLNGLPPGEFPVSIFDLVLNGQTVRGSIVGTRKDLEEALQFAAEGKVKATIEEQPLHPSTIFSTGSRRGRSTAELFSISLRSPVLRDQPAPSHIRVTRSPEMSGRLILRKAR